MKNGWGRQMRALSTAAAVCVGIGAYAVPASRAEPALQYSAARDGLIATSRQTPGGVVTRIWAEDGSAPAVELRSAGGAADLELATARALDRYGCLVARANPDALVPYDGFGCDSFASGLTCTVAGGCCDRHDYCYAQHRCNWKYLAWPCAGLDAFCFGTPFNPLCILRIAGCFVTEGDAGSPECAKCNQDAAVCISAAFTNGRPGPSTCCGRDDDQACGRDRCEVYDENGDCLYKCATKPDGTCEKPCTDHSECGAGRCDPETGWCRNDCGYHPDDCRNGGVCMQGTCRMPCDDKPELCEKECEEECLERPGTPMCTIPEPSAKSTATSAADAAAALAATADQCNDTTVVGPVDPNEMIGPDGTGEERWVDPTSPLAYQVLFENVPPATATAQEVVIVNYLDPNLDWSTLTFGQISFGGRVIDIPDGTTSYAITDVPPNDGCMIAGTATGELAVEITVSFNAVNGRIEVRLKVIDTATGDFPADVYAGILPPDGTVCANGQLTYAITPRADAASGSVISNSAAIIFDANPAVTTNEWWNTLL